MSHPYFDNLSDADLWEHYRDQGLSAPDATHHVQLRQQARIGPAISGQEMTDAQTMGGAATGIQAGAETVGRLPSLIGQALTGPATHLTQWLVNDQKSKNDIAKAGNDIYKMFGSLDPANALSPDEAASVNTSQQEHPLATDIGTATGIFGVPAALGTAKMVGNRLEGAALRRRLLEAQTETAEERLMRLKQTTIGGTGIPTEPLSPDAPAPGFWRGGKELPPEVPPEEPPGPFPVTPTTSPTTVFPGGVNESQARAALVRMGTPAEAIDRIIDRMKSQVTPSGVAPTVPSDTPTLRPGEAAEPIPGTNGQGIAITGKRAMPVPPTSPTILEMQQGKQPLPAVGVDAPPPQPAPDQQPPAAGEQVNPAAQQAAQAKIARDQAAGLRGPGGSVRWARNSLPPDALGEQSLTAKAEGLKQLLAAPEAQYQAGKGILPPEIIAQVDQLRAAGATPAHVDALLARMTQPADVAGTASTMRNPMYAKAAQIAQQVVKNPTLAEKYGYAGMSPEQVTRALQDRMLQAGKIPPLTSLDKFLARLHQ